jgi:SAM-dependent methyltransferase
MKLTHPKQFYKNYIADDTVDAIDTKIAQAIENLFAPDSIFEFGCGSGKNLILAQKWAWQNRSARIETCGQDISPLNCLNAHMRGVDSVIIGDERHMPMRKFDVCFTVSVLDHIPPDNIEQVVGNLQAMATNGVVIAESEMNDPENFYWNHDYSAWGFVQLSQVRSDEDGSIYIIWVWSCAE